MKVNPHTFKELKTQETKISAKLKVAEGELHAATKTAEYHRKKLESIRQQLSRFVNDVVLSEHALLRYIEREKKIDLKSIKAEILTDKVKEQIKTIGSGKIPCGELNLIVKNNVIVSIVPKREKGYK